MSKVTTKKNYTKKLNKQNLKKIIVTIIFRNKI